MSYAVQGALLAVPAIGLAALAIDLGWIQVVGDQLQTAADAGALAAATRLPSHRDEVVSTATLFVQLHEAGAQAVVLDPAEVQVGVWDHGSWTVDSTGDYVRVGVSADRTTFLARVFGVSAFESRRSSVATMRDMTLCGVVGLTSLDLGGATHIDSFDSTLAAYAPGGQEAGVCSNAPTVDVRGNTSVLGDVLAGVGGEVNVLGSATVSRTKGTVSEPLVGPLVSVPGAYLPLPSPILAPVVLPPGDYYLLGDFAIHAGGAVVVTGETHLYVDGDVTINGQGFVNTSSDPHALSLEVIGTHHVSMNGSADFYGALVAPGCDVTLNGGADLYGTVVANDLRLVGNLVIHVDQSLVPFDPTGGHAALVE